MNTMQEGCSRPGKLGLGASQGRWERPGDLNQLTLPRVGGFWGWFFVGVVAKCTHHNWIPWVKTWKINCVKEMSTLKMLPFHKVHKERVVSCFKTSWGGGRFKHFECPCPCFLFSLCCGMISSR